MNRISRLCLMSIFTIPAALAQPPAKESAAEVPKPVEFNAGDVWNVDIFKSDDHKVLVIQDRKFTKARKFELGLNGGVTKGSPFYNSLSYGVHADYHLTEYFGFEAFYTASTSTLTADATQINDFLTKASFSSVKEFQKPLFLAGAGVLWSPIYGKFAFFRRSIIHFDIFGSAGLSVVGLESNHPLGKDQTKPGSLLSIGARVFLSRMWSLRFEVRHNLYQSYFAPTGPASNPGDPVTLWRQNFQFTLGTSVSFGGKDSNS